MRRFPVIFLPHVFLFWRLASSKAYILPFSSWHVTCHATLRWMTSWLFNQLSQVVSYFFDYTLVWYTWKEFFIYKVIFTVIPLVDVLKTFYHHYTIDKLTMYFLKVWLRRVHRFHECYNIAPMLLCVCTCRVKSRAISCCQILK